MTGCFTRSVASAIERIALVVDHGVDCVVARPEIVEDTADAAAGICLVWSALRRILKPTGSALLLFGDSPTQYGSNAALAWRTAFALQEHGWMIRNALIGPAMVGSDRSGVGFIVVSQTRYHFDAEAVRRSYGKNPGDVVLPGPDCVVDRFIRAACPRGGRVIEVFERERREVSVA